MLFEATFYVSYSNFWYRYQKKNSFNFINAESAVIHWGGLCIWYCAEYADIWASEQLLFYHERSCLEQFNDSVSSRVWIQNQRARYLCSVLCIMSVWSSVQQFFLNIYEMCCVGTEDPDTTLIEQTTVGNRTHSYTNDTVKWEGQEW